MHDTLKALRNRLSPQNTLFVLNEGGMYVESGFVWNEPADNDMILGFEDKNGCILPTDFKEFLKVSNGAELFKDLQYGQWGCRTLPIQELEIRTKEAKDEFGGDFSDSWIVFATWYGDRDYLIFDTDVLRTKGKNYILDGDQGYGPHEWDPIKGTFEKWLERLIIAQGCKYWRWY